MPALFAQLNTNNGPVIANITPMVMMGSERRMNECKVAVNFQLFLVGK